MARIIIFMIAILAHGRQVEWTARLDFLWQLQASQEKREMAVLQQSNKGILYNLLPAHVAGHFLENQFRNNMDTLGQQLYHYSYAKVGVIFCSIPNFHEFYTELDGSHQGVECLRLLNEIIADFDELLCEEKFKAIDKIKTVGSTYMAAVGLIPEHKMTPTDLYSIRKHMVSLMEFIKAMRAKLQEINDNSYNSFMLRVGVNVGPVVAGVIGARKPQYDIWGNTVNVASRMDSTGIPGYTQVTQDVVESLQGSQYTFRCRGQIKVKGKGDMVTYFLCDRYQNFMNEEHELKGQVNCNNKPVPPVYNYDPQQLQQLQQQQHQQQLGNYQKRTAEKNYYPNVIDENYIKKESYNFVESPNLIQNQDNCINKPNYSNRQLAYITENQLQQQQPQNNYDHEYKSNNSVRHEFNNRNIVLKEIKNCNSKGGGASGGGGGGFKRENNFGNIASGYNNRDNKPLLRQQAVAKIVPYRNNTPEYKPPDYGPASASATRLYQHPHHPTHNQVSHIDFMTFLRLLFCCLSFGRLSF